MDVMDMLECFVGASEPGEAGVTDSPALPPAALKPKPCGSVSSGSSPQLELARDRDGEQGAAPLTLPASDDWLGLFRRKPRLSYDASTLGRLGPPKRV